MDGEKRPVFVSVHEGSSKGEIFSVGKTFIAPLKSSLVSFEKDHSARVGVPTAPLPCRKTARLTQLLSQKAFFLCCVFGFNSCPPFYLLWVLKWLLLQ